jgi:hypothetical protein
MQVEASSSIVVNVGVRYSRNHCLSTATFASDHQQATPAKETTTCASLSPWLASSITPCTTRWASTDESAITSRQKLCCAWKLAPAAQQVPERARASACGEHLPLASLQPCCLHPPHNPHTTGVPEISHVHARLSDSCPPCQLPRTRLIKVVISICLQGSRCNFRRSLCVANKI